MLLFKLEQKNLLITKDILYIDLSKARFRLNLFFNCAFVHIDIYTIMDAYADKT